MAAETHPSSSSSSDNYDVFLSFRGEDTRGNFTDHLYTALVHAGIRTFRDNEELHHGEEIGLKLLKSIEQSRISIPIFSKNYASSKWCLQELIKIMECKKTCGQIVLPIFYKVEPSHVRNQTGRFKKAFLKHKKEQCQETVRAWRQALEEAGNLKGWDSEDSKYRYETNLIDSVVGRALSVLSINTNLQVAEHPTGIDSHVKEVERMLDFQSEGVQFVGIHGMGGIGKTTTAKAVFNTISNQFESRRFLEDVREKASQYQGLVNLQKELVSDLLKGRNPNINSVSNGINEIKKLFRNKKVLIVLDDVDQDEQLRALAGRRDWFGSGSRIIITTRDEHILRVDQVDKSKIYKPKELDGILSLQLFSKHAFGRDQPPQEFMELSKKVVSILGGLPLAIEVVGSLLRDEKEHMVWEDTLKKLEGSPQKKVQEQLKISYTRLDLYDQKLFLDIACFFIGVDIESVIPAWQACGYFPRLGIKVLIDKSLIKIDNDNKLRMHDQLRDMGREIIQQENLKKPGKRSRLWSHKEALEVLKEYKGTVKVEGLFLDFRYQKKNHQIDFDSEAKNYWTGSNYEEEDYLADCDHEAEKLPQIDPADLLTKAFENMSDLRLLQVDHADHDRNNFGHLPQGLKWLSLKRISCKCVPTISRLKKLAVLDLSGSDITDDWNGWQQIQSMETLKVLDLSRCSLLEGTPHFSCNTSLERLILNNCINLVAVHESIGHLKKLVFLSLDCCYKLTELADSICKLSSIRSLILSDCYELEKLPKELGNMESLTELIIDHTSIEEIPDSIGLLEKLERLSARGCISLVKLPHSMGTMKSITELIIDGTAIEELPDAIGSLEKLERLSARECGNLTELQDSICKLSSIRSLILSDCCRLEKLPKELGNMESLTELIIDHTIIEEIPDSIGLLEFKILSARDCSRLEKLPNLSNLRCLQAVCLSDCWKLFEIQGISGLSLLQQLDLKNCRTLKLLPELPPGLIKLNISGCTLMERLPNLSTLKSLKELRLDKCYKLAKIEGIDGLTLLQEFDFTDCKNLQSLPELPSSLIKLNAKYCSSIVRLTNLSNLKNLQALLLRGCKKLSKIQGISDLPLLQQLDLKGCFMLQSLPELPPSLIRIDVSSCYSLERLPNLSMLKELKDIHLRGCYELAEIEGIDGLTLLQELDLTDCRKLQSLPVLPSSLIKLDARGCCSIETLPNLSNLKSLQVSHLHCSNLSEIQDISGLSLPQELDLIDCKMLQFLPGLPSSLITLEIEGCILMERSPNLSSLRSLKVLSLKNCMNLANIQGINDLTLLENLALHSCRELQSLDLSNLRILESLRLEDCDNLAEIRGLESLESLIDLQVCRCHTYVKTLPKRVAEARLPTAVNEGEICNNYLMIPDDDNIKGMIFYFVYQLLQDPASSRPFDPNDFYIEAKIQRNDGKKPIRCVHDLRIEGMNANTNRDQFYSCYFQGRTWFGFPLKKWDKIYVKNVGFQSARVEAQNAGPRQSVVKLKSEYEAMEDGQWLEELLLCFLETESEFRRSEKEVKLKMLGLVMEYEAMEGSQQLEKQVVHLITSTSVEREGAHECGDEREGAADRAKKRPREYVDDDDAGSSNWDCFKQLKRSESSSSISVGS